VAIVLLVSTLVVISWTDVVERLYDVLFYTGNSLIVVIEGYFKDPFRAYLNTFLTAIALIGVDDDIIFS